MPKNNRLKNQKQWLCTPRSCVSVAVWYISLPFSQKQRRQMTKLTFCGGREHKQTSIPLACRMCWDIGNDFITVMRIYVFRFRSRWRWRRACLRSLMSMKRQKGGSVAKWLERLPLDPGIPGSRHVLTTGWICSLVLNSGCWMFTSVGIVFIGPEKPLWEVIN